MGNEIRDEHPALVVSTDALNESSFGLLIVVPISSSSPPMRIHVDVPAGEAGLPKFSRIVRSGRKSGHTAVAAGLACSRPVVLYEHEYGCGQPRGKLS
jgi:hypothetical protein